MTWPEARLDRVRQLRVLGAALPGVAVVERVLDAPFDEVWSFLSDLERSVPMFDHLAGLAAGQGGAGRPTLGRGSASRPSHRYPFRCRAA